MMKHFIQSNYDLFIEQIALVQNVEDEVYQIQSTDRQLFKLKIIEELNKQRKAELEQLYNWVAFLKAEMKSPFPTIIPNKQGELFSSLQDGRKVIVMNWIDWPIIPKFTVGNVFNIGQLLAKIHQASQRYHGSHKDIKVVDGEWIMDKAFKPILAEAKKHFSPSETRKLAVKITFIAQQIGKIIETSRWGIIHSDLHRKNIIYKHDQYSFIDFDDAMQSNYLLDLAVLLNELADFPKEYEELKIAFLRGYQSITKESIAERDIFYYQRLSDILYAEWVFRERKSSKILSESKQKYGLLAIKNIIELDLP
jgi:Ser/Thr protein kinase RdoA (MazF antagonist)